MALKQIVPIFITLQGDGSSTVFTFALENIYQAAFGGSIPFGSQGVVPSSVVANNPPVPVTSTTVDANGNITITLTSALGSGVTQTFEIDIVYNSGAASSSSPTQSQNVTIVGTTSTNLAQVGGTSVALGQTTMASSIPVVLASNQSAIPVSQSGTWNVGTITSISGVVTIQGDSASGASNAGNPVKIGGAFNTTQPTVTNGQTVDAQATARGALIVATGVDTFTVSVSGTAAVTQSGTWTVQQGGAPWSQNLTQVNSVALGSPSNYGTSPGTVSVLGVNAYVTNSVTVAQATASSLNATVVGTLTHNNAAPTSNNIGVLPAVASSSAPTYTANDQVLLSTDLSGNLRVSGTFSQSPEADLVGSTGTLNAANATATINAFGYNSVGMLLAAGTLIGTIVPEASADNSTWVSSFFIDPATGNYASSIVFASSNSVTVRSIAGVAGASNYRVRVSAFTSGTASCTLRANYISDTAPNFGGAAGAALPPVVAQAGGSVTTNAPSYTTATVNALSLDTSGLLRVSIKDTPTNTNTFNVNIAASAATVTVSGTVTANQGGSPWSQNLTQVNSVALGSPSNYGTSPGAVSVIGVNAYVTNTVSENIAQVNGSTVVTAATGVQKVGVVGNAGATFDVSSSQNQASPTNMLLTGAEYNSAPTAITSGNVSPLEADTVGSLYVNPEGRKASYRVGVVGGTPISSSTAPTFSLTGSSSKTVRITRIRFSATAATGAAVNASLMRFSALSGGTSASQASNITKMDINDASATAVVNTWSAAATTATSAGILTAERYEIVTASVSVLPGTIEWTFGDKPGARELVLRGTSDFVGVLFSGVGTTPIYDIWVEFTEE